MRGLEYKIEWIYASVMSRRRRTVLDKPISDYCLMNITYTHLRTVAAAVVVSVHAPPAIDLRHELQFQMPTEWRLTVTFPQNVQVYLACCVISIFLTCFRSEAPYLIEEAIVSV